jgi:2-hydroxycyclohexanecarboxyl-CoA dehydrogenase
MFTGESAETARPNPDRDMTAAQSGRRRLALVSGGAGAIGAAICRQLNEDGWEVAIGYVTRERAEALADSLRTEALPVVTVPLDMQNSASIGSGVGDLLRDHGRIDSIVFVAGLARTSRFVDTTEADWNAEIAVNLLGPMLVTKLCLPLMIEAGHGTLVGITSEAAKFGDSGHASYSAAKAGLNSFFKTIVREHGRHGITASCVAPGPIDTPMMRYAYPTEEAAEQGIAKRSNLVPLKRMGTPDEVAAAVRFLCSDATFIAGEQLSVGGGVSMQ